MNHAKSPDVADAVQRVSIAVGTSSVTVLRHTALNLVKTWCSDGTIRAYDKGKHFAIEEVRVSDINELSALLSRLEQDLHVCIIRGAYIGNEPAGKITRKGCNFEDRPLHFILIEVDEFEPLSEDPVIAPVSCIREYIIRELPPFFQDVSFHWQLSNSAGHPKHADKLKVHLWFWLEQPYTSAELHEWAENIHLASDHCVFNPVQIHYTGRPIFEEGIHDPVPVRSGYVKNALDAVPLLIDNAILNAVHARTRPSRTPLIGYSGEDPVAQYLKSKDLVLGFTADRLYVKCPWDSGHSTGVPGDSSSAWLLAGTGNYETGHYKCLHQGCQNRTDGDFFNAVGYLAYLADGFQDLTLEVVDVPEWPQLDRTSSGGIKVTLGNLVKMLSRPDITDMRLRYDAFRDEVLLGDIPLTDVDYTKLRLRLERLGFPQIKRDMIRDVAHFVAHTQTFDSAQEWLNGLEWDGTERIERFYPDYLGTEDTAYTRAVSLYHWTAQAGRILHPGAQADMVPVLIGEQGSGKSSAIRALVPDDGYYAELSLSAKDDDLARRIKGVLVAELAELRGLRGKEIEHIKAFITKREEEHIPKYMEKKVRYPRRVFFVGTTNQDEFLADETGNRRWLPVIVGRQNIAAIERDCLQLWAEAREHAMLEGIQWRKAEELARPRHVRHMTYDPWEDQIEYWLHQPDWKGGTPAQSNSLRTPEILRDALGFESGRQTRGDDMRVGGILRKLGYSPVRETVDGKQTRVWKKTT